MHDPCMHALSTLLCCLGDMLDRDLFLCKQATQRMKVSHTEGVQVRNAIKDLRNEVGRHRLCEVTLRSNPASA